MLNMIKNNLYTIKNIILKKDDKSYFVFEKIENIHLNIGASFQVVDIQKNVVIIKVDSSKYAISKEIFNYLDLVESK